MAVVSIPGREPLGLRNQTLRELCARAGQELTDADDRYQLEQAGLVSSLAFDNLRPDQRQRIATAIQAAARAYRAELLAADPDRSDLSRAEVLDELARDLSPLVTG